MSGSMPRPPTGVPPPITPAVVTATLPAVPLDCARIAMLVALMVPAAVVAIVIPPVPLDCALTAVLLVALIAPWPLTVTRPLTPVAWIAAPVFDVTAALFVTLPVPLPGATPAG